MKRKEQYADEIIEMLERTKCGAWASNINLNTKDIVIEVCQNVVDNWSGRKFKDHCTTLPQALEQEPKTGHWIEEDMFDGDVAYRCSECNALFWIESGTPKDNEYNFCLKCGTKMVEPQERSE